jgi:hypothetical protein
MSCSGSHLGFPISINNRKLYKLYVFCSDMKFKMLATAGLSLTLNPMGKCSNAFSETTNIIKAKLYTGQFGFNCPKWFERRSVLKHFSHRVMC